METHTKGGRTIKRLYVTGTTLRKVHTMERKHTRRGDTWRDTVRRGDTLRVGTHTRGNIHDKEIIWNGNYAERGYTWREDTQKGDIHEKRTHAEWRHIWGGGIYTVRGIHGEGRGTHTKRRHAEWGHTRGEDIYGKQTTWNGNYTEKGEGTHTEKEHIRGGGHTRGEDIYGKRLHGTRITRKRERGHIRRGDTYGGEDILGGEDMHGKKTTQNGNYTEKGEGTYTERGHAWSGDTHGGDIHDKEIIWNENYT